MKLYKILVPVALILLMAGSWYMLLEDKIKTNSQYNKYLDTAREYAKDGITLYAIDNYEKALAIKNEPDVYEEIAVYYKNQNNWKEYLKWSEEYVSEFPKEARGYELLLEQYLQDESYGSCYDVLESAEKRQVSSERLTQISEEIKYKYSLQGASQDDVGLFNNNYCMVLNKEKWGFVNYKGSSVIGCVYDCVASFSGSGIAPVKVGDVVYYIDKNGNKVKVPQFECEELGMYIEGMSAVKKKGGKWTYVDSSFKQITDEFDYATTYNSGVAAVKIGSDWKLINSKGQFVGDNSYLDVKLDEKEISCRHSRIFVSASEGKYILIDNAGKRIGSDEYTDACVFGIDGIAAVALDGRWFFIDVNGKRLSEKTYDEARSFSNEFAAVKINGKWGFVDSKENIVIEPQFHGAKDFSDKGSCFVNTGSKWQLLKIYRLNR
ncbi:MAG: WG repeat-containing protein [Lachnospiraceae bacterium]